MLLGLAESYLCRRLWDAGCGSVGFCEYGGACSESAGACAWLQGSFVQAMTVQWAVRPVSGV